MRKIINSSINLIMIIFGLLLVLWILWARFIRERLPKDIPFDLTEFRLYLLFYICSIFLFIIYHIIKTKATSVLSPHIKRVSDYLYTPLTKLDTYIKTNKFCIEISVRFFNKLADNLSPFKTGAILDPFGTMGPFYFFYNIIPRLILASLLLMDIFIFKKIDLFYSFVLIGIIPILRRYLKYSIKNVNEVYQVVLERHWKEIYLLANSLYSKWTIEDFHEEDDFEFGNYFKQEQAYEKALKAEFPLHEDTMTIKEYLSFRKGDESKFYKAYPLVDEERVTVLLHQIYYKYLSLEEARKLEEFQLLYKNFTNPNSHFVAHLRSINILYYLANRYKDVENLWYIKSLRILAFSLYFFAWFYILIVSFHTLQGIPFTMEFLNKFSYHLVEFRNLFL